MKVTGTRKVIRPTKGHTLEFHKQHETFDKVRHKNVLELLREFDLFRKHIKILRNVNWKQMACLKYIIISTLIEQNVVDFPDDYTGNKSF